MRQRGLMLLQLAGSAAILGFLPGNVFKAVAFLAWWAVTFRKITRRELIFYLVALVLFSVLDYLTLRQGIFRFDHPDFLLMPCYEPLLWGYLLLHTVHMVDGPIPRRRTSLGLAFTIAFMLPFLLITDPLWLFCASAAVLGAGLIVFHEGYDLAYIGYLLLVGIVWEHVGVWTGQWSYPVAPANGVPPWFAIMFGGIGLALRRLVLPLLTPEGGAVPVNARKNSPETASNLQREETTP